MKDTAGSIDCMNYIPGETDLDVNTYAVDTWSGRVESDQKLPDPKCSFCLNPTYLNIFLKKKNKPFSFKIDPFFFQF